MIELSLCDICNMPIAILINFFYLFLFLLPSFSFFFFLLQTVEMFLCHAIFFFLNIPTWKILFSDFILHTFRKFKFQFYHSTKRHTFSFWPRYISYVLLIIDTLPVELSLLMPLLHLSVEGISSQCCFLYIFITNIRYFKSFRVFFFQVLPEIVVNLCRFYWKENISFHFISFISFGQRYFSFYPFSFFNKNS